MIKIKYSNHGISRNPQIIEEFINENHLKRENIIQLFSDNETMYLVYEVPDGSTSEESPAK
ncbi:hypothetical protein [Merdimmobilis hominis]|uniref:hypothetical protein n=1 Tax=Merdimmobilis hominis TaxID=2897707 RepID=UPI0033657A5F